jgi:hypothetical protein
VRGKLICGYAWGLKEGAHEYADRVGINLRLQNGVHVRPWSPDRLLKYLRQTNKKSSVQSDYSTSIGVVRLISHTLHYFCPDSPFPRTTLSSIQPVLGLTLVILYAS